MYMSEQTALYTWNMHFSALWWTDSVMEKLHTDLYRPIQWHVWQYQYNPLIMIHDISQLIAQALLWMGLPMGRLCLVIVPQNKQTFWSEVAFSIITIKKDFSFLGCERMKYLIFHRWLKKHWSPADRKADSSVPSIVISTACFCWFHPFMAGRFPESLSSACPTGVGFSCLAFPPTNEQLRTFYIHVLTHHLSFQSLSALCSPSLSH